MIIIINIEGGPRPRETDAHERTHALGQGIAPGPERRSASGEISTPPCGKPAPDPAPDTRFAPFRAQPVENLAKVGAPTFLLCVVSFLFYLFFPMRLGLPRPPNKSCDPRRV